MNQSFYDVKKLLEENGVKDASFLTNTINKDLKAFDLSSPIPAGKQVELMVEESKNNIWYYFRESLIPAQGGGFINFKLNVGICALIYLFEKGISAWVRLPRCSYATHTMKMCMEWYSDFNKGSHIDYYDKKLTKEDRFKLAHSLPIRGIAFVDDAEFMPYNDIKLLYKTYDQVICCSVIIEGADEELVSHIDNLPKFTFNMYDNPPSPKDGPFLVTYSAEMIHDERYFNFNKAALREDEYTREILLQRV